MKVHNNLTLAKIIRYLGNEDPTYLDTAKRVETYEVSVEAYYIIKKKTPPSLNRHVILKALNYARTHQEELERILSQQELGAIS